MTTPQPQPRPRSLPPIPAPSIITMIDFDLQGYIDNELASGKKDIIIPLPPINHQTGVQLKYRITPRNKHHLLLKGLNGVTITTATAANYGGEHDPSSSIELICTETTRAITLLNCIDVTIKGFIIDYNPLPYTQGYIVGFGDSDKPWLKLNHEIELSCGQGYISSNHYVDNYKYEIYQFNGTLRYGSYFGTKIQKDSKSPSRFTVTIPERYSTTGSNLQSEVSEPQIGDIIVIGCTYAPSSNGTTLPHAICCMGCNNIKFEDITLYSSNNYGFYEKNSSSTSYIRCIIDRRRSQPRPRQSSLLPIVPRMRSLNADAFHSSCARKGPTIIDCIAKYMGDDGINIHGEYHIITKAKVIVNTTTTTDNTTIPTRTRTSLSSDVDNKSKSVIVVELRVLSRNKDDGSSSSNNYAKINIEINDSVEIMTYNGEDLSINDPVVTSVCLDEECPEISDDEKIFLLTQKLSNDLKTNKGGSLRTAYRITIEINSSNEGKFGTSLLCIGSVIASTNKCGNNFKIISNEFGYTRSRGIIVKSSNGIISYNTMMNCVGESIRIAPGYWWLESGNSNNIKIQDNLICNCSSYGIGIYSFGSDNTTLASSTAGHNNIMIRQNTISNCPIPNILVTSATNVNVKNNQCRNVQKDVIANGPPNMNNIVRKEYDTNEKLDNDKTIMIINCSDVNAN